MINDYLINKKNHNINKVKKFYLKTSVTNLKPKNVDINKLLNGVKINEQNKKKESWILFGLATGIIGIVGIFITF